MVSRISCEILKNKKHMIFPDILLFLAHLSQRLIGVLIGYSWSCVRRRKQFQTSSSPKPFAQSKPNFMWSLLGQGKRKFVHGTWVTLPRWPPRPYMVKTLQKSSSPEPACQFLRNLVCSIGDSSPSLFFQMMTLE